MDPENEEERRDEQENSHLLNFFKKGTKKAKSVFSMMFRRILAAIGAPLIIKLLLITLGVLLIVVAFSSFMDKLTDNLEAGKASSNVLQDEEVVSIESTNDGRYYFKISQDVVDKYLEGIDVASLEDLFGEIHGIESDEEDTDDEEIEIDEEDKTTREDIQDWFTVEDFDEYLVKMLRAEIASSYPKLSDYTGNRVVDNQGNKVDSDGDYVAQGVAEIHRQRMNQDGSVGDEYELEYLPYDSFMELVNANDASVLNKFSFVESSGLLYYATYVETIVTVDGVETSRTYTVSSSSVSYKSITSLCSMPYNFLFALLQTSENPNYVMAVIDLLLEETDLVLMIQDQLSTTVYTEVSRQAEKTTKQTARVYYDNWDTEQTSPNYSYGVEETTGYVFPAGASKTEVTTTYRNTANVYIKKAYTWCLDFEQEVTLNSTVSEGEEVSITYEDSELEGLPYTLSSSSQSSSASNSYTIFRHYLSTDMLPTSTKTDTKNYTWNVNIATEKRINYERFVGLWKNDTGEYYQGCLFDENGEDVKYQIASEKRGKKEVVVKNISDNDETIGELLLELSVHDDTEIHEQLMMYYWNIYMGRDVYDVDIDGLLDLFNTSVMTSISGLSSSQLLREYIRAWEGGSGAPTNADGTMYVIVDDGAGNLACGYGIDIYNGGYYDIFIAAGYTVALGAEVDIDFVDALEDQAIEDCLNSIKSLTSGLDLTTYQLHALVSRAYNCGVSGAVSVTRGSPALNFVDSYTMYWDEERDDLFEQKVTSGDFTHSLYTQYMSKPTTSNGTYLTGLARRRQSEWTLFQAGYYDVLGKWCINGGSILEAADQVHNAQITWTYSTGDDLYWNNIEMSLNNPNRVTCCATFVSSALYVAGYFTEAEMNSFNYNYVPSLYNFLKSAGWQEITSYSLLEAGDVVFEYSFGHVQLYAGDNTWYNAGSTNAIQRSSPYYSYEASIFTTALRAPN